MRWRALIQLAGVNLRRNRLFLVAALLGVTSGVAILVFFAGLSQGLQEHLVERLFQSMPETRIKVSASRLDFGLFNLAKPDFLAGSKLNDGLIATIEKKPGVAAVFGEMAVGFPIKITGSFFGQQVGTDLIASGIDPQTVADELRRPQSFSYREKGPVPVLVSYQLLELYNSAFAPMNGFPIIKEASMIGFRFDLVLGRSYLGGRSELGRIRKVQCELVGFSKNAIAIGITLPLEYVKRWNKEFTGKGENYQAIYADLRSPEDVTGLTAWLTEAGFEVQTAKEGVSARVSSAIRLVTGLLLILSAVIMALAALNLSFLLFLMVRRRRREFGLWRTLGARRSEMAALVGLEALFIGLVGGLAGCLLGVAAAGFFEQLALSHAAALPFAPEHLFAYPSWLWPVAMAYALIFTLLGALAPALRAAGLDPVRALKG